MQCVEFEQRLNELLDARVSPGVDADLAVHAQNCALCSELLAGHEMLLEGIQALPGACLSGEKRKAFAQRVLADVGSVPVGSVPVGSTLGEPFPSGQTRGRGNSVDLADRRPKVVATNAARPTAMIALVLATAAAVMIALIPWFRGGQEPAAPNDQRQLIVDTQQRNSPDSPDTAVALTDYEDLAPIARVGYQVADRLTPVTSSMVSALRELRKRPFFRNSDESQRSSFYSPHDECAMVA